MYFCPLFWRIIFFVPLVLGSLCGDTARAGNPVPLTMSQAVEKAGQHHPRIQAAQCQVDGAGERIVQARSGFLPQVSAAEKFQRTTNPMWAFGTRLNQEIISAPDFDPVRLNDPDAINNFNTMLSVVWPVYDNGQTLHGWHQARMGRESAELGLKGVRQGVMAGAVIAYMAAQFSQRNLEVVEQSLASARSHLKMVEDRFTGGFVVKSDLLRAQVRIAELEQAQCLAACQVENAAAVLNAAMGEPPGAAYVLTTPLETQSEVQGSLEQWIEAALKRRPDSLQAERQEAMAQEEIKKTRAAHLPGVSLFGNYEINTEEFNDTGDSYTVGAVVNLNLYSGGRDSARIAEARAALAEVQAMRRDLETGIRVQTRQAYMQSQSGWRRIGVAAAAVAQAEEGLRIVSNRYKGGLLTIVELLDAEVALEAARKNHFQSLHDYRAALTHLALAAGCIDDTFTGEVVLIKE
jgi:outer membrane protein TolC